MATLWLGIAPAFAQIPNGGFEDWVTVGSYQDPVHWQTGNAAVSLSGVGLACEKGTPGAVGNAYAKVTTRNVPGVGNIGGLLISEDANGNMGFPYASRPAALNGLWKHAIAANDSGSFSITLTKYDAATQGEDLVGIGSIVVYGAQADWQAFSIAIQYLNNDLPDKAVIEVVTSMGTGVDGSAISLDDLSFGDYTGLGENDTPARLSIRPTLATDELIINAMAPMEELDVLDLFGRTMESVACDGREEEEVAVSDLSAGRYFLKVRMADGTRQVRSFVKQ